jgi:hypothetical protein
LRTALRCRPQPTGPGRRRLLGLHLAKALQHLKVQPDLSAPPRLGLAQSPQRLRPQPSLHPEDHDLMEPRTGGVEQPVAFAASLCGN